MEISNSLAVIIFLACIIVPIWWLVSSGNKKKKALANKVNSLKAQYHINISDSDSWDNVMLGIDKAARKILWIREVDGNDESLVVDLGKIEQCKKVNVSRNVNVGKVSSQVLDHLGLELFAKDRAEKPVLLDFYNSNNSYIFNFQLELQDKWQKLIGESLKS
ncbi:MAG: hypothetical protein K9J37_20450 [Saprospiraceae bacterium]|nr:hypothetical protein [Saprospiraceae bacterium]MCF8252296.1 hypothetical protein [Saprospiraceae bacterium]MCF8282093.1 hypothetical protein [Bacteroidales bacterium]MCF8313937.1 hypothetical protein [Saprospiraceae bacterium]MCF8442648.1 hypothetical protein [Saprospiraceae bacterium]